MRAVKCCSRAVPISPVPLVGRMHRRCPEAANPIKYDMALVGWLLLVGLSSGLASFTNLSREGTAVCWPNVWYDPSQRSALKASIVQFAMNFWEPNDWVVPLVSTFVNFLDVAVVGLPKLILVFLMVHISASIGSAIASPFWADSQISGVATLVLEVLRLVGYAFLERYHHKPRPQQPPTSHIMPAIRTSDTSAMSNSTSESILVHVSAPPMPPTAESSNMVLWLVLAIMWLLRLRG